MNKTGYVPPMRGAGEYRDAVLEATDLQSAHILISEGSQIFDKLPATTREYFSNDPLQLHEFLMDQNLDIQKGIELGIFQKEPNQPTPTPEPQAPPVVPKPENKETEPKK